MMVGGGMGVRAPSKAVTKAVRRVLVPRGTSRVPRNVFKFVKREIDKAVEDKYITGDLGTMAGASFGAVSTTWQDANVSDLITQGIARTNRIGNKIRLKSFEMYGILGSGAFEFLTDDPYNVMRIIVGLWDSQITTPMASSGMSINGYLGKACSGNTAENLVWKFYDKFIPLMITSTEKGAGDGYTPQIKTFHYKKLFKKPIPITWSNASPQISNHKLIVSMVSDSSASVHPGVVNGWYKLTYEDA